MAAESIFDRLTLICLGVGLALGLIGGFKYDGFLAPLTQSYLGLFGLERHPLFLHDFATIFAMMALAWIGMAMLAASIWIEGGDSEKKSHLLIMLFSVSLYGLIGTGIITLAAQELSNYQSGFPSLALIFWVLASIPVIVPALVCWLIVFPVALGLLVAGLLCLPRLLFYFSIRHPLRQAWEDGKQEGVISSQDVSRGLGHPARNTTEARKLKSDLERLEREVKQHQAQLEKDRDAMRSAILQDVERFETEKRISAMLRNLEALNSEVSGYREYMQREDKK